MIHAFCAPSEQLQQASCFSNQASPGLLMTVISWAAHCPGTRSVLEAGGKVQLHLPSPEKDHVPRPRVPAHPAPGWSTGGSCRLGFLGRRDTHGRLSPAQS